MPRAFCWCQVQGLTQKSWSWNRRNCIIVKCVVVTITCHTGIPKHKMESNEQIDHCETSEWLLTGSVSTSQERLHSIITKPLGMKKVSDRLVPKLLTSDKNTRTRIIYQFEADQQPNCGSIWHYCHQSRQECPICWKGYGLHGLDSE